MLLKKIQELKPKTILDVGCGCGSFTQKLSLYSSSITAIDPYEGLINRSIQETPATIKNIHFICMDGKDIKFHNNSFEVVFERASLHHEIDWKLIINEMIRVSSEYILIEEPFDDLRNKEKQSKYKAQQLFLRLQNEVGYFHFNHILWDELVAFFESNDNVEYEKFYVKSDEHITFDSFFEPYETFVSRSKNPEYWLKELDLLREELSGQMLSEDDTGYIFAQKIC